MTVKEQMVELLREAGYDFMTACEEADKFIQQELRAWERGEVPQVNRYEIRGTGKTLTVRFKPLRRLHHAKTKVH